MTDNEREKCLREIIETRGLLEERDVIFIRQIQIMVNRYIEKSRS